MEKLQSVERIKKEFDGQEFLRDTLIRLSLNAKTPPDICESQFSQVYENEAEFLNVNANVYISYSCMVGQDRKEEYIDQETYYKDGARRVRNVKKTRTVTDWTPLSGTSSSVESVFVRNTDEDITSQYIDDLTVNNLLQTCKKDSVCEYRDKEIEACSGAIVAAYELCKMKCFDKIRLPGDHQKDKDYNGTAEPITVSGLVLTEYSLTFTYKGKEYKSVALGSGEVHSNFDAPDDSYSIKQTVKKKMRPILFTSIAFFAICLLFIAFSTFLDFNLSWALIPFFVALFLIIFYCARISACERKAIKERLKIKLKYLEQTLSKNGLQPLTEKEKEKFA